MSEAQIITGQYVQIAQSPASIGERTIAFLIDFFLIVCYFVLMGFLSSKGLIPSDSSLSNYIEMALYLMALLYPFLMEVFNHGQTIGKKIMKIRVIKKDGSSPSIGDYLLRWMLLIIDFGFSGIGFVVILFTKNRQRLGDMAAGTMVIQLKNYKKIQVSLDEFSYLERNYVPVYPQAEDLSLNQIDVIQRTLDAFFSSQRDERIAVLAQKVRSALSIPQDNMADEKFLYTILRDYQHYSLEVV